MKLQRAFFVVVALVFVVSFASVVSGAGKIRNQAQVGGAITPTIQRLVLINADTDQPIADLTPGYVINTTALGTTNFNIEAKTSPATVGSVGFKLDTLAVRTENTPPYAYAGDNGAGNFNSFTMAPGSHSLTVNAYTLSNRTGTEGPSYTINFSVNSETSTSSPTTGTPTPAPAMAVTSLVLVNADTNQDIRAVVDGEVISLDELGTDKISLRAETTALPALPGSVRFKLNGVNHSTENLWPFTIPAGVANDDYRPWNYTLGEDYVVAATPYVGTGAGGAAGIPLTVSFKIILSEANAGSGISGHTMVTTLPAMGCLTATVTNSSNSGDSANPGSITVSWPELSGYSKYKVWRIQNGNVIDSVENIGTAYTTNYVTPGTWSIKVAFLDPAAALNSNGDWGPETIINNLIVGLGIPPATSSTCTTNTTTGASITLPAPSTMSVIPNQPFTFTVVGTPTDGQISSVRFSANASGIGPIYPNSIDLGTDNLAPFTTQATIPLPGVYSLAARVTLNNGTILNLRKSIFVTSYAMTPNAGTPVFTITNPDFSGVQLSATLTEDVPYTINYTTSLPSGVTFQGAEIRSWGGDTSWPGNINQGQTWNGAGLTPILASIPASSPNGSTTITIPEPGVGFSPGITNVLVVTAYFSNTVTKENYRLNVLPVNDPTVAVSNIQMVRSNGTLISTLPTGSATTVNIGTQNGGLGTNIAIKANTNPATVGSVKFYLDGVLVSTENSAPYSMHGDAAGVYTVWPNIPLGAHTIKAVPYPLTAGGGTAGTFQEVQVNVVNNDTVAPLPPTGVTVTYRSATQIKLAWTASAGAANYKIYRTGNSMTFGPQPGVTYTDTTGLSTGGAFSYVVTALNASGQESPNSVAAPNIPLLTTYTLGTNVRVTSAGPATVKSAPDGGNLTPQQPELSQGTIGPSATPVYYNGIQYWQVNFNTGQDGWVDQASLQVAPVVDTQDPNQVTGLTVGNPTSSTLYVDWSPTTDLGGSTIANYQVWRSGTQNGTYAQVGSNLPSSQTDYTDTGLNPTQTYWYKILAIDSASPANTTDLGPAMSVSGLTTAVVTGTCNPGTAAPVLPGSGGDLSRTNGMNKSVQMSSAVTGANQITICWDAVPQRTISGSISVFRKSGYTSTSWGTAIATLSNTATSYVDNGVTPGTYYEYKVSFSQTSNTSLYDTFTYNGTTFSDNTSGMAYGYIATGISVPEESSRGKMALVIDNSMASGTNGSAPTGGDLASRVITLIDDLNADRWSVYPIYVGRGDSVSSVKALIVAQNPAAIYLLGHVPVDKTHTMYPDGHGDQIPWSSDAYYSVSGSYGTTVAPVYQIGRVDAFKMEVFGAGNPSSDTAAATTGEKNVVGAYLDKVHSYKIGGLPIQQRAVIKDVLDHGSAGFSSPQNAAVGAWATFPSIVGLANTYVTNERGTLLTPSLQASTDTYLLMTAQSGGQCDRDNDASTGTSAGFAAINGGAVFNVASGSRFGSFDNCKAFRENNFLKAIMFGGKGMVSLYGVDHHWYLHSLAMGQNIGYATKMSINNHSTQLYTPVSWLTNVNYNAFMSPLGDPSIRASYFTIPSTFTASGTAGNPINFSWSSVSGAEGYNVYKITSSAVTKLNSSMITSTSYTGSEIYASGAKYMVTALDLTTSGSGGTIYRESLGKIALTTGGGGGDVAAPSTPTNFAVSGTPTTTGINLSWTASVGNPVGESVTYKILRSNATNGTYTQIGTDTASPYSDTGLTAGTTYFYRITASDAMSNTSVAAPSATTGLQASTAAGPDTQAPTAPAGLMSTAQTTSSITLTWNASTGSPVGEAVTYKVFRSTTANGTYTQTGSATSNTTFTDSGLTAGTMYYYKVSASDALNNTSAQNPSTGYGIATSPLADTQPPTVPAGLTVTGTTSSSVSLSWNASTDVGGSQVQGYLIYRSATAGGTYTSIGNSGGTTYTDSGLSPSTTYYYKVSAIDNSSNGNESAQTASVSGTTTASSGGGAGQVLGLMGYAGPNNNDDVTPTANPFASEGVKDYFIDCAAGNDSNNGTSISTPWRTIAMWNSSGAGAILPGGRVFFKRGTTCRDVGEAGVYSGTLDVWKSGTATRPIEYKAYGSGAAPIITGAIAAGTWTLDSGSVYKTNIGANRPVKYLYVGNSPQTLARTPNKVGGNTTWLYTDTQNGQGGGYYLTDSALPTPAANNLVGATVIKRYSNFNYDEGTVWAHAGNRLDISSFGTQCYTEHCGNDSIYPQAGWGFIVQNDKELLDAEGEWYYNSTTGDLYFRAPGSVNPNTLTVDVVIDRQAIFISDGTQHVAIKNLVFEKYAEETIYIGDNANNAQLLSNIKLENNEIRYAFVGIKNDTNTTDLSKKNNFINNYIHDVYNVGIWTAGYGHLYQGNVLENIAMDVILGSDNTQWAYFGIRNILGNTDIKGNILRNIGYIGISNTGIGEVSGNLIDNASAKLNDGCGMCADKGINGLVIKDNIIKNSFGNIENVPANFVHASAITSSISTGDTNNVGVIIRDNVVMDFGNTGIAFDHNFLSQANVIEGNTIFTALEGNETGAAGLKYMDQSVGVVDAGTDIEWCQDANFGCYVANFNNITRNNDVYMLHPKNHTMYFYYALQNAAGNYVDYGNFYGNYLFHASKADSITDKRAGLRNNDLAEITPNPTTGNSQTVTIYTSASATTSAGSHTTGDNATITNRTLGAGGNYFWQANFTTGVDGWVQEYNLKLAPKTIAEWQTINNEPPSGQAQNTDPGYSVTLQADMPKIYVNDTGSPMTFNPGTGWCDKNGQSVASISLTAFADVKVVEKCSLQ